MLKKIDKQHEDMLSLIRMSKESFRQLFELILG